MSLKEITHQQSEAFFVEQIKNFSWACAFCEAGSRHDANAFEFLQRDGVRFCAEGTVGDFDANGLASRINKRLLGRALPREDLKHVSAFINPRAPLIWPEVYEAIGLAASAPGYQWY